MGPPRAQSLQLFAIVNLDRKASAAVAILAVDEHMEALTMHVFEADSAADAQDLLEKVCEEPFKSFANPDSCSLTSMFSIQI